MAAKEEYPWRFSQVNKSRKEASPFSPKGLKLAPQIRLQLAARYQSN